MEEDDMVKSRYGNTLVLRRTDEEGKGCRPEEFIRRCQGLALAAPESPWACTQVRGQKIPYNLLLFIPILDSLNIEELLNC